MMNHEYRVIRMNDKELNHQQLLQRLDDIQSEIEDLASNLTHWVKPRDNKELDGQQILQKLFDMQGEIGGVSRKLNYSLADSEKRMSVLSEAVQLLERRLGNTQNVVYSVVEDYATESLDHMKKLEDSITLMNTDVQDTFYEALNSLENIEKELSSKDNTPDEIVEGWIAEYATSYEHSDNYLLYLIGVQLATSYNDGFASTSSDRYKSICAAARQILANNSEGLDRQEWHEDTGKRFLEQEISLSLTAANTQLGDFVSQVQRIEDAAFQWLLLDLKERGE